VKTLGSGLWLTDKEESQTARTSPVLVGITVVTLVGQHFDDEEDDRSGDIPLEKETDISIARQAKANDDNSPA
jgi:hypothetical protein